MRINFLSHCFLLSLSLIQDHCNNPRYASSVVEKLLKSAIANAENNNGMDPETLYVEECFANKATTMKRIRPGARGTAYRIEKRMSHITVIAIFSATSCASLSGFFTSLISTRIFFSENLTSSPF